MRILRLILRLPLGALALLAMALAGLLGSTTGTRLLLGQAQQWSGGALHIGAVEGRLLGRLALTNLRLDLDGNTAGMERVLFDWRPGALLHGDLDITALHLKGVHWRLPAAAATPVAPADRSPSGDTFALPHLPHLPHLLLGIRVCDLWVDGLRVQGGDAPSASLISPWRHGSTATGCRSRAWNWPSQGPVPSCMHRAPWNCEIAGAAPGSIGSGCAGP